MLKGRDYLPIGTVVLLEEGYKKAMIIGIMQSIKNKEDTVTEFDYIGVIYPEGFLTADTMILFNHSQITDVIYRGYENPEREKFVNILEENMERVKKLKLGESKKGMEDEAYKLN